eukprot:7817027-Alexandrium_andersonii.AAC.1
MPRAPLDNPSARRGLVAVCDPSRSHARRPCTASRRRRSSCGAGAPAAGVNKPLHWGTLPGPD